MNSQISAPLVFTANLLSSLNFGYEWSLASAGTPTG
ncbi:hypothetical protein MT49_0822 [Mycobacterium tuberculosis 49-02]|nr:hypothetical protein MT49_0822 [Mycobacterium tuberculosis 49-02]